LISWQAKALNLFLKQSVKRVIDSASDIQKLRKKLKVFDKFTFNISSMIEQSRIIRGGMLCDEFKIRGSNSKKTLLYIHGGAFVFQTPALHNGFLARLVGRLDLHVIAPDYPLAPEQPFPAAIESCFELYKSLIEDGINGNDIILGGDSAGGNIALVLMQRIKKHNLPMPVCSFLLSPATDMIQSGLSSVENRFSDVMFSLEAMLYFRQLYVKGDIDLHNEEISPLFSDFTGYPPCMIHVSSSELMRDDSTRLAEYMKAKGVDVKLQLWHNMPHVFGIFEQLPESKVLVKQLSEFIDKY